MTIPAAVEGWRSLFPAASDFRRSRTQLRRDVVAGTTVALVALPLALAFGVASGMGARAGIVTAIIAGSVAAVFGGSNLQVSGPTGAMTVVLIPIVHRYGSDGVLTVGLLAGVLLVLAGLARLGRAARYLPTPVVEGFTAGIAVVIALQQVPAALGVTAHGSTTARMAVNAVSRFVHHPEPWAIGLALGVMAFLLLGSARWPALPFSLLAVAIATAVAVLAHAPVTRLGTLPGALSAPSIHFLHLGEMAQLAPSAVAVAALGALESLLSATVADGMTVGQSHDPDRELVGQGLANLAVPLFGGTPATAAIARTAVNVRAGAGSRWAALTHAVVLAAIVYAASDLVARIPLAALAGVLLATCVRMVEFGSLGVLLRASRSDAIVLLLTLAVTVVSDLVHAVLIGLAVAVVLALRKVTRMAQLEHVPLDPSDHSDEEFRLLSQHIVAYRIDGPLFFAAAHRFLLELTSVADVRVLVLRMSRVTVLDTTGARVLADAINKLEHHDITVLLSGLRPAHQALLDRLGLLRRLRAEGRLFPDTPAALARAYELLTATDERPSRHRGFAAS